LASGTAAAAAGAITTPSIAVVLVLAGGGAGIILLLVLLCAVHTQTFSTPNRGYQGVLAALLHEEDGQPAKAERDGQRQRQRDVCIRSLLWLLLGLLLPACH
jgi:hypothetical protein